MMIVVKIAAFVGGLALVLFTLRSALLTFVLPRSTADRIVRFVFRGMRRLFNLAVRKVDTYAEADRIMALYAPISLLSLVPVWLFLILIGYTLMYWATGISDWREDIAWSGSSLLTLGFRSSPSLIHTLLAFTEAAIGLIMVALLIAYLPTMYSTFSRREVAVTQLASRAGSPPSALEFILRVQRIGAFTNLPQFWAAWETLFAEIEETHTSLGALAFFRSPHPDDSWLTAAGAVLDSASILASTVDVPRQSQAELCIRAGYLALRHIADFFEIEHNATARYPEEPISVAREEYDAVYDELVRAGVPVKTDREQAWRDFAGWRVNYDRVLIALCALVMAPYAPWSSDRSPPLSTMGTMSLAARPRVPDSSGA